MHPAELPDLFLQAARNHVHILVSPAAAPRIFMHTLKRHTALQANRLLTAPEHFGSTSIMTTGSGRRMNSKKRGDTSNETRQPLVWPAIPKTIAGSAQPPPAVSHPRYKELPAAAGQIAQPAPNALQRVQPPQLLHMLQACSSG